MGQEGPLRREGQPTPVFLPGELHGLRSLAGYSPWGRKELDTTERLTHTHTHTHTLSHSHTHPGEGRERRRVGAEYKISF